MAEKQFDPHYWPISLALSTNFFEVPVYQRPYSWSEKEVNSLLSDIFDAYKKHSQNPDDELFTGTLFLRFKGKGEDGVKDKYEVVDGQQRLATFSMMLLSIYSIARRRNFSEAVPDVVNIRQCLWKYSNQQYNKKERLLTLNSIDANIFAFIFDSCYDDPIGIVELLKGYQISNSTEQNIRDLFLHVYETIDKKTSETGMPGNEIITFFNFVMNKVIFIAIQSSVDMPRVFSVFESINSKGKPLDRIDLIKTFIFSKLEEKDYNTYLTKWGQLIIKTNDCLEEYMRVFTRAYSHFYRQAIGLQEFGALSRQLMTDYHASSEADGLKKWIDDMVSQADTFGLLSNEAEATKLVDKSSFKVFYKLFLINRYEHPQFLIFRAFAELKKGILNKDEVTQIVKSSVLFMFKFQSINGGDSKDAYKTFQPLGEHFYGKEKLDAQYISDAFIEALKSNGVDSSLVKSKLLVLNAYPKRELAYSILALVESIDSKTNRLSFGQASLILSHIKDDVFQLDHMLPQKPDPAEDAFKYYMKSENGKDTLVLKDGHDFPEDVFSGMDYGEFESRTLNRIGNIQFLLPDQNKLKDHDPLILPSHESFTTFQQTIARCEKIAKALFDCPDLIN
jgi:hypothetical protein